MESANNITETEDVSKLSDTMKTLKLSESPEEWRNIEDYGERYLVSNKGNIWSVRYKKLMSPFLRMGYKCVGLSLNGKNKKYSIHTLVALTFLENPLNKYTVNHKDGNKLNNNVENLEWATTQENVQHAQDTGLVKRALIKVKQYDLDGNFIKEHNSINEGAIYAKCSPKHIPTVCRGGRNQAGGYIWRYSDIELPDYIPEGRSLPGYENYIVTDDGRVYSKQYRIL